MTAGEPLAPPTGRMFRQSAHTGAGMIVLQALSFFTSIIIARGLGPEGQGRFQFIMSVAVFLTMIASCGLDEAVAYWLPRVRVERAKALAPIVLYVIAFATSVSLAAGTLAYLFADGLAAAFGSAAAAADVRILLPLLPSLMVLSISLAVLRGLGRAEWRASIYYYVVGGLFFGGVLLLAHGGLLPVEAYRARIASVAIGAVIALAIIWRDLPTSGWSLREANVSGLHLFAGWIVPVGIFQYAVDQPLIDLFMVGRVDTSGAVGLYAVAAKAAAVVALSGVALNVVMAPQFATCLARGDFAQLRQRYRTASLWTAGGSALAGVAVLVLHRPVLLLFGEEYVAAASILQILACGQLLAGLCGVNTPLLLASGFVKTECALVAAAAALLVCTAVYLGQRFGAVGVAIASAGTIALLAAGRRVVAEVILSRQH